MGYGGYLFGIPAILLAAYSIKKEQKILGIIAIIFASIGIAESFIVMHILVPFVERTLEEGLGKFGEEEISVLPAVLE
ncbi:MAG: hypothetical protein J7L44_04265, partial [Candidatus Diapherotrites archaeon]|nr:hypothetical protein [Candidatus Diapherotrites archaeon]